MSFPRYPAYKDSGVEWLGEMPGHWKAVPLKAVTTHNDDVLDEATAPDTEITYVDISSVDGVNGIKTKEEMLFAAAPSRARRCVEHGDVIVSTVRTYLKAIARIRDPEVNLVVSTGFAVIRPRGELTPDFLGHLISAGFFVDQVIARSTGVSYPAINASALVAIPVLVPPLLEQAQIAAFLDRETAKIDAMVAEQRRLMELLKEKRQAVISHAITRGLNLNAPMKPSGIEWLGYVPSHWELDRLKHSTVSSKNGVWGDEAKQDEYDIPCVRVADFDRQGLSVKLNEPTIRNVIDSERAGRVLVQGNLLLEKSGGGECQPVGCVVLYDDPTPAVCSNFVARIQTAPGMDSSFWRYVHAAAYAVRLNTRSIKQTSGIQNLDASQYFDEIAAFPPQTEQTEIATFLGRETAKIDALAAEQQRLMELLKERRTALISAAVTGQIDVTGVL